MTIPRLVIAGTQSGVGKTTIATALMAALSARGLRVQGFKVGPDYIDPSYHSWATGRASRNLDPWLLGEPAVRELFERAAQDADVAVIEGVMGLFDGHGAPLTGGNATALRLAAGSTAHVAALLQAPVVLVLDASKAAASAAATALGFRDFSSQVRVAGVILNRIASTGHRLMIEEPLRIRTGLPVWGGLPTDPALNLTERALGLETAAERRPDDTFREALVRWIEAGADLDALIALAGSAPPLPCEPRRIFAGQPTEPRVRIGIARDEAFQFYYQDSLDVLTWHGVRWVPFSPLRDPRLPREVDALFFGGGFPERHLPTLAGNVSLLQDLRRRHGEGLPIYAECGGLMYLCQEVVDTAGTAYPLAGLVPTRVRMTTRLAAIGYRQAQPLQDVLFLRRGEMLRGHEFHYSTVDHWPGEHALFALSNSRNERHERGGYAGDGLAASYLHLHFAAHPLLAARWVRQLADKGAHGA